MKNLIRNWKTTLCGLAAIFSGLKIAITSGDWSATVNYITIGLGLFFAKDGDVTGL
tara:strand:+ start:132 stop:299 length:168 start_codon:yes stop_codon:yes gene_type:complete